MNGRNCVPTYNFSLIRVPGGMIGDTTIRKSLGLGHPAHVPTPYDRTVAPEESCMHRFCVKICLSSRVACLLQSGRLSVLTAVARAYHVEDHSLQPALQIDAGAMHTRMLHGA